MYKVIRPEDIAQAKSDQIPEMVIACFNDLIAKNYRNGKAKVLQKDVVAEIEYHMGVDKSVIFSNNWLDVEEIFRTAWKVEYEKPAYCESFEPYFTFTKPRG